MRKRAIAAAILSATALLAPAADAQTVTTGWCADKSNVSFLGASTGTGYGTTGHQWANDWGYFPTTYGYVARVARNASAEWGTATNVLAHNGARIQDHFPDGYFGAGVNSRWDDTANGIVPITPGGTSTLAQIKPDLVLIGGVLVNEYVVKEDPVVVKQRYSTMIDKIREASPGTDILLITYVDIQWHTGNSPAWSTYANINHQVAVEKGLGLIDLRQYVDSPAVNSGFYLASENPDYAHMNDYGQASVSAAIWTLLWRWALSC